MGVSLERVQFKFASIIGELCSEPDVLSQFAVWLDLRLAEYKLKGNISLDCSDKEPSPGWLCGLKLCRLCGACRQANKETADHFHPLSQQFEDTRQPHSTSNKNSEVESDIIAIDSDEDNYRPCQEFSVYSPSHKSQNLKLNPISDTELNCTSPSALPNQHNSSSVSTNQYLLSTILPSNPISGESVEIKGDKSDVDLIAGSEFDHESSHHFLGNNSSASFPSKQTLCGSFYNNTHRYSRTYNSIRKLTNAEKQKLYRAKMKETMTEEQKQRTKILAKQRYLRWKSKHCNH